MGQYLLEQDYTYNHLSLLATAARLNIPLTVNVAVGTDIIHIHSFADGASIGKTTYQDFRFFCGILKNLAEGGLSELRVGGSPA